MKTTESLRKFIQEEVLTTPEAIELLGVTRARISQLIRNGKLVPVKKTDKVSLFLREDVEARKKEINELQQKYGDDYGYIGRPMIAIFPDGTEIKADNRNELIEILKQKCSISGPQIGKLVKTGEPFQPKWQKLEPLRGLIVKYVEE